MLRHNFEDIQCRIVGSDIEQCYRCRGTGWLVGCLVVPVQCNFIKFVLHEIKYSKPAACLCLLETLPPTPLSAVAHKSVKQRPSPLKSPMGGHSIVISGRVIRHDHAANDHAEPESHQVDRYCPVMSLLACHHQPPTTIHPIHFCSSVRYR